MSPRLSGAFPILLLVLAATPTLAELQVTVNPERIAPVALGDARVWNAYVTVTVVRDGRPGEGALVELRGPSGPPASGRADAEGKSVLPVLSREPVSIEVWVDGAPAGRRVELVAGPGGSASPPAAAQQPPGFPGWAAGGIAAAAGALVALLWRSRRGARRARAAEPTAKKRFKRGD